MKNKIYILFLFFYCMQAAASLVNLGSVKHELRQYHDSGAYIRSLQKSMLRADDYLSSVVRKNKSASNPKKLAVVLDIDETSLSNYSTMEKRDFASLPEFILADFAKTNTEAITPTLKFYNHALQENVAVFFITGRPLSTKESTIASLHHAGYRHWSGLYFKTSKDKSNIAFKTSTRKQIEHQGYTIVESIGDQESDLVGGYAQKTFKLANPYYYVP